MPIHKKENEELYIFANALRDMLDLDPLYQDGRSLEKSHKSNEDRFYIEPYEWGKLTLDVISKS